MILAIDAGNSRIKWGLHDTIRWLEQSSVTVADLASLKTQWRTLPHPKKIIITNVAGENIRAQLESVIKHFWKISPSWLISTSSQCGVKNSYADSTQLGSDRWAALIAAWQICKSSCLVVNAGTATTIDALSEKGIFLGGVILPGLELMQRSLEQNTAGLKATPGHFEKFPKNTANAMLSGSLQAQAGAIERLYKELASSTICILSGGSSALIQEQLNIPTRSIDNLVLEGLIRIAME